MSRKRAGYTGGDVLTGGTKDVNPQWIASYVTQASADTQTSLTIQLPNFHASTPDGKAYVVELLKIYWDLSNPINQSAGVGSFTVGAWLGLSSSLPAVNNGTTWFQVKADGGTIDYAERTVAVTHATPDVAVTNDDPILHDLTDGAGHGVLIGTDKIVLTIASGIGTGTGLVCRAAVRLLYRIKAVTLAEYIGIVQSQQGAF